MHQMNQKSILVIVLLIAVLGAGYYLGTIKNSKSQNPTTTSENIQTSPTPTSLQTSNDNANWKTYSKQQYGVQLKYHPYWEKGGTEQPDMVKEHILSWDFFNNPQPGNNAECLPYLKLTIYDSTVNVSETDKTTLGEFNKIQDVDGQQMMIYTNSDYCGDTNTGVMKLKNNNTFEISVGQIKDKTAGLDIFNQILSTFKATN